MNAYALMVVLYLFLAVLAALNSALASLGLASWFNGMRWLRVHLITLGTLTEMIFWLLPIIVALRNHLPKPRFRWDIWGALNAGLLLLLTGIPATSGLLIIGGGTFVFVAVVLLIVQLAGMRAVEKSGGADKGLDNGRKFYLAGLSYFLVGIIVGSGLWFGWSEALNIKTPLEVHIHANNWGLMSLVFAGLLVDFYPTWAKRPLANPQSVTPIFWMMTVGAFGLIFGPWLGSTYLLVPGLVLHLGATAWLLFNVIKPLRGDRAAWEPGMAHIITSYFWILAPVLVAPFILLGVPGVPGASIEANAPQALIYGWVLQFGYALVPYLFGRLFTPDAPPKLGGNWLSLTAVHLGGVFLWASIFAEPPARGILHGTAYLLWLVSMLPIVYGLWNTVRSALMRFDSEQLVIS